jgi:F-type H+-transporting ATPase subunit alpha
MTHLPIVETLQGDVAGYIPSNIISMTDGQVYFNASLFGEGFKPAIDMGLSVSRIGSKVQWNAVKKISGMLKLEFVRYKELEKLTRIKAGVSPEAEARLQQGKCLEELLKQDESNPCPMEEQVIVLYAFQNGFLKTTHPSEVRAKLAEFVKLVRQNCPDQVETLISGRKLTDEVKEALDEQLDRFIH